MRRLLSGITVLTVFAGCVASVGAEARDWRGHGYRSGNFHGAVYRSGGSRGRYAGAWRGGGYRGYGFYGASAYPGYYQGYGWGGYGDGRWWGPVAAASAILPFAAAAATQVDYSDVSLGGSCATPEKTCELYSEAQVGTGCSCKVPGGHARGVVE